MTKQISDATFQSDVLDSDKPVVVDFFAEWCGPCKMMAPGLAELAEEMADDVTIVKIDAEESPEAPSRYGVRGFPTLIVFKGGEPVAIRPGAMRKSELKSWIEASI
jgi:thioredoxin 1